MHWFPTSDRSIDPLPAVSTTSIISRTCAIRQRASTVSRAQFGDQMFSVGDAERKRAYKAAVKLAVNDNVRLYRTQSLKPRLRF